ncbi:WD40-repeat containing protein [Chondrus crispus]|uniref:Probable cytosolic iron-sulfur protein assembly protein CIAO1 homolog n=1 Tax=Chondrus crispus TaxID=2769 RepID=R7QQ90_CHOCR|nr:WD40-repeat containing protein [Chondrus crispus]CDF39530.1 WD40-repeat containing protein [Chondrus crispus]|eukprot:XP_005713442.1 WD40-repeat containing protein [Chondrus crispus]
MPRLELQASLYGHKGAVWSVAWSPRGLLASCGADKTVRVWHRAEGGAWRSVAVFGDATFVRAVRDLSWASDGRSLACASFDASAFVLELMGGKTPHLEAAVSLEGHDSEVKSVAYSSSGALLASCSRDKSVWVWEVGLDFDYECIAVLNGHAADVKMVAWHPTVEMLVSTSFDGTVRVWVEDEDDWFCAETLAGHNGTVWAAAFGEGGTGLATVAADGGLAIWSRENPPANLAGANPAFQVVARYPKLHAGPIYSVDWNKSNSLLATGGGDDCIRIIQCTEISSPNAPSETSKTKEESTANGSVPEQSAITSNLKKRCEVMATEMRAHSGDVNRVAWNPIDQDILASSGDDGLVKIWKYCSDVDKKANGT